ncbi:MAG: hypothetical protein ACOYL8_04905 [Patescibacteria group bacterium]
MFEDHTVQDIYTLSEALTAAGLESKDLIGLSKQDLSMLKLFAQGRAKIIIPEHVIDGDVNPKISMSRSSILEHKKIGKFVFDPSKIFFYEAKASPGSKFDSEKFGPELRDELKDKCVLPASVLDYLLDHQEIIPEEWKERDIYFWGTIFVDRDGYFYVRCLTYFKMFREPLGWGSAETWLHDMHWGKTLSAILLI